MHSGLESLAPFMMSGVCIGGVLTLIWCVSMAASEKSYGFAAVLALIVIPLGWVTMMWLSTIPH
jgi:hypothetical protein